MEALKKGSALVFLCTTVLTSVYADEASTNPSNEESAVKIGLPTKRKSQIRFSVMMGRDQYRESELSARLGLDPVWALNASIGGEKSEGIRTATSFSIGASANLNSDFDVNFSLQSRREPDSVVARGVTAGMNWNFASLWESERSSEVSLQGTFMRYKQDEGLHTRVKDGGISQNSLSATFTQEVSAVFSMNLNYTTYELGGSNSAELSRAIGDRPNVSPGFLSVVEGFPKRAYGIGGELQINEDLTLNAQVFKTDYFNTDANRGMSISAHFDVDPSWTVGVGASGTRAASSDQKDGLLDLSLTYRW